METNQLLSISNCFFGEIDNRVNIKQEQLFCPYLKELKE